MERQTLKIAKRRWVGSILLAMLGTTMAAGAPAVGATHTVATGHPSTDFEAIQSVLDAGGEVLLQNGPNGEVFDRRGAFVRHWLTGIRRNTS